MSEFAITYSINGQSYAVLDDSTVGISYDMTQGSLAAALDIIDDANIDSAILAVNTPAAVLSATITYPAYTVECDISGVEATVLETQTDSETRRAYMTFDVAEFTVV